MPFRRARENASEADDADSKHSSSVRQRGTSETSASGGIGGRGTLESVEGRYGPDAYPKSLKKGLYRQTRDFGPKRVRQWAEDGVPVEIMGKPRSMDEFRERQEARPPEVPRTIEQQNEASIHRSKKTQGETDPSGDIGIPGSVRDVVSSPGKSLDDEVRSGLEDRLGTSLDHVQVHTGPKAQQACEEVNARAFAVGNHIAFGPGEYAPSSAEGQHLIAHEVVHTLQQPDAEMSMMPKADLDVEIDPDPKAEREADEIAGGVMKGGEVGMHSSWQTDVHVQRLPKHEALKTLALLEVENEEESDISEFRQDQNENRIQYLRGVLNEFEGGKQDALDGIDPSSVSGRLQMKEGDVGEHLSDLNEKLSDRLDEVGLTDDQRAKIDRGIDTDAWIDLGTPGAATVVSMVVDPLAGLTVGIGKAALANWFGSLDGDIEERMEQLTTELEEQGYLTGEGDDPTGVRGGN